MVAALQIAEKVSRTVTDLQVPGPVTSVTPWCSSGPLLVSASHGRALLCRRAIEKQAVRLVGAGSFLRPPP